MTYDQAERLIEYARIQCDYLGLINQVLIFYGFAQGVQMFLLIYAVSRRGK